MKVIGMVFVILAASSVGFSMSSSIRRDRLLLLQLQHALQLLRNEIAFCGTPLPQTFALMAANCTGYLERVFSEVAKQMDKHRWMSPSAVMEQVLSGQRDTVVSDILKELAAGLGDYDVQSQLISVRTADERAATSLQRTEQEGSTTARIYETLGICSGLSVAILLI